MSQENKTNITQAQIQEYLSNCINKVEQPQNQQIERIIESLVKVQDEWTLNEISESITKETSVEIKNAYKDLVEDESL